MDKPDIPFLSATELSQLIKKKEVPPVEATEAYLDRIAACLANHSLGRCYRCNVPSLARLTPVVPARLVIAAPAGRLAHSVPPCLGPAPRRLATSPQLQQVVGHPYQ